METQLDRSWVEEQPVEVVSNIPDAASKSFNVTSNLSLSLSFSLLSSLVQQFQLLCRCCLHLVRSFLLLIKPVTLVISKYKLSYNCSHQDICSSVQLRREECCWNVTLCNWICLSTCSSSLFHWYYDSLECLLTLKLILHRLCTTKCQCSSWVSPSMI